MGNFQSVDVRGAHVFASEQAFSLLAGSATGVALTAAVSRSGRLTGLVAEYSQQVSLVVGQVALTWNRDQYERNGLHAQGQIVLPPWFNNIETRPGVAFRLNPSEVALTLVGLSGVLALKKNLNEIGPALPHLLYAPHHTSLLLYSHFSRASLSVEWVRQGVASLTQQVYVGSEHCLQSHVYLPVRWPSGSRVRATSSDNSISVSTNTDSASTETADELEATDNRLSSSSNSSSSGSHASDQPSCARPSLSLVLGLSVRWPGDALRAARSRPAALPLVRTPSRVGSAAPSDGNSRAAAPRPAPGNRGFATGPLGFADIGLEWRRKQMRIRWVARFHFTPERAQMLEVLPSVHFEV